MALRTVTPPTGGLITLDQAKAQCRVDHDDDDDLIDALVMAATDLIERETQRKYLAQTLEWVTETWSERMCLPIAPGGDCSNAAIVSVKYMDLTSTQQTLDPSLYWDRPVGRTRALIRQWYAVWPLLGDGAERVVIRINITSTIADVPPGVVHACKMLVSHFYENRDAVVGVENRDSSTEIPFGVERFLSPERWEVL